MALRQSWMLTAEDVIEEIHYDMSRRHAHAVRSQLERLITHLLTWRYQPGKRETGHSWASTIRDARHQIARICTRYPSLARQVPRLYTAAYAPARRRASDETHLPLATFSAVCPWSLEEILAEEFWPAA